MDGAAPGTAPARLTALAALGVLIVWLLAGCAAARTPPPPPQPQVAAAIVRVAIALVGAPYHFGGADEAGFDCSGLTVYVYERVGLAIPRTAAAQRRAAYPVALAQLAPGDLVFFRIRSHGVDHVGVYTGDGRFVHAPRAGQPVSFADLSSGFYARHLAGGGRWREPQTR